MGNFSGYGWDKGWETGGIIGPQLLTALYSTQKYRKGNGFPVQKSGAKSHLSGKEWQSNPQGFIN